MKNWEFELSRFLHGDMRAPLTVHSAG